jgi:hypothetical protein
MEPLSPYIEGVYFQEKREASRVGDGGTRGCGELGQFIAERTMKNDKMQNAKFKIGVNTSAGRDATP